MALSLEELSVQKVLDKEHPSVFQVALNRFTNCILFALS